MSEWPGSVPDELEPAGEQLALPYEDGQPEIPAVFETIVHRIHAGPRSWSCACGAGKEWGPEVAPWRPRQAARIHLQAVRRRVRHDHT